MSWPIYSTRFVVNGAPNVWNYFNVPVGRLAIVKCVLSVAVGANGGDFYTSVGPGYGPVGHLPGPIGSLIDDCHLVAYAGETIGCMRTTDAVAVSCHGYLLTTTAGARTRRPENEPGPPPDFEPATPR